jgi:general stress protein YciG
MTCAHAFPFATSDATSPLVTRCCCCWRASGLHTDGATVSYGFGETAAVGSPMADMQPGTASAHVGGAPTAAAASYHPKRKMSEMGEVGGDHLSPLAAAAAAAAAAAGGEEVQECSMQQHSGPGIAQGGTQLGQSAESEGQGWAGGLNRCIWMSRASVVCLAANLVASWPPCVACAAFPGLVMISAAQQVAWR